MSRSSVVAGVMSFGLAVGAVGVSSSKAQMLINPAGGTVLSSVGDDDRSYSGRPLGFIGTFFGVGHTTVDVSSNGNLNFSSDASFGNALLPDGPARISPMWDDLYVYSNQSITESVSAGNYYAVTWRIGTFNFGHVFHQFQVVWFGATQTIRGFTFQPNDIAFCYESVGAPPWDATAGLNAGDGANFVSIPGTPNGGISDANAGLLPLYPSSHNVILFRPVGSSYISMPILTNTPCPADFNNSGSVNSQDFFDFLAAFFAGC